jgi:hypothetical protein
VIDERRGGSALYEEPERLLVFVDGPSEDLLPLEILYHFLQARRKPVRKRGGKSPRRCMKREDGKPR